jgi:hypothetical protein
MKTAARVLVAILSATTAMSLPGCAVFGWIAAQFGPEKKVPAEYEFPAGQTILVFVDDILHPVDYEPVKIQLTEMLNAQLIDHKVASKTIPYPRLGEFIAATPGFNSLAIGEVGRKLGADVVLYVQIDDFSLRDAAAASELWKGRLATTVWLVDVVKGRFWPTDNATGREIKKAQTQTISDSSQARGEQISKDLAGETADKIAKLFYSHTTPYEGAYGDKSKPAVE